MKMLTKVLAVACLFLASSAMADVCLEHGAVVDGKGTILQKPLCYEKVINSAGGTLSKGMVVVVDSTDDDGVSVTTSTTVGAIPYCMVMEDISDGATGKCQTYGYTDVLLFSAGFANATAGGPLYIVADSSVGGRVGRSADTAGYFPVGVALDSSSSTGAVEAFLKMR